MTESQSYLKNGNERAVAFSLTAVVLLLGIGAACLTTWDSTPTIRVAMETLASSAALFAGVLALVRHQTRQDSALLLVGAGLVVSGWLHGCQVLEIVIFPTTLDSSAQRFGLLSRFVLAVGFFLGSLACGRHSLVRNIQRRTVYTASAVVALASTVIPLPEIHFANSFVHRPSELVAAGLLALALWIFVARRGRRSTQLHSSLIAATILFLVSTLVAAFQPQPMPDAISDLADVLGIVACLFVIVGLIRMFARTLVDVQRLDVERKQSVAELARANECLDAFLRSASHDLKAPLRHIFNFCGFVRTDAADRLTVEELKDLDRVTDAATHMSNLLASLLDFAKLGETSIRRETHLFEDIVETVVIQLPAEQRDCVEHGELSELTGDRALLTIVMQNIIENGLKYCQADRPQVTVSSESSPEGTKVSVADNGIGVPRHQWSRIFEPGVRCVSSSEYEGTGYGLATCSRIIHAHGGKIWIESTPEMGSTLHFMLPNKVSDEADE